MTSTTPAARELTDLERDVLAFERRWWKYAGAKQAAIRDRFGLSSTRYYQVVNALLDRPEALEHDPLLVARMRRQRERRRPQRRSGLRRDVG